MIVCKGRSVSSVDGSCGDSTSDPVPEEVKSGDEP